jgi:hypothetical protein
VSKIKSTLFKAALVVLGLTPILYGQTSTTTSGPQFCPGLCEFLRPTLLDVWLYPGITFQPCQ